MNALHECRWCIRAAAIPCFPFLLLPHIVLVFYLFSILKVILGDTFMIFLVFPPVFVLAELSSNLVPVYYFYWSGLVALANQNFFSVCENLPLTAAATDACALHPGKVLAALHSHFTERAVVQCALISGNAGFLEQATEGCRVFLALSSWVDPFVLSMSLPASILVAGLMQFLCDEIQKAQATFCDGVLVPRVEMASGAAAAA